MQKEPTDKQVKTLSARQQTWQMLKFTLFSISAGGIQFLSFTLMNEMRHPRSAHRDTPPCRAGSSGAKAAPASRIEARRPEALLGTLAHATPSAFYVNLQMFMPIALHRCAMFAQASLAFR